MLNKYFKTIHNKHSKFLRFIFFLRYLFAIFFIFTVLFLTLPSFFDYEKIYLSNFVHRLDIMFTAKVTKYINTTFSSILYYDLTQDKDVQISQVLNVGFLVKLGKD